MSGDSTRGARARRIALVAGFLAIAIVCFIFVAVPAQNAMEEVVSDLASVSVVGDRRELAAWESTRGHFLNKLQSEFPKRMAAAMNFTQDPCNNFYEFSCGRWIAEAEIPATQTALAMAWDAADDQATEALHKLLAAEYPRSSRFRPVSDWFKSCMDVARVQQLGARPLRPWLNRIDSISNKEELTQLLVDMELWDIPTMISMTVSTDTREPLMHDLFVDSSGTILPDVSFYDADTKEGINWLNALHGYLSNITELAGYSRDEAEESARATLDIEQRFAEFMDDEPQMSLDDSYKHTNLTHLEKLAPHFPWRKYFKGLRQGCEDAGITCLEDVVEERRNNMILSAPHFFRKFSEMFHRSPAAYWRPFLRTHLIYNLSPLLSLDFINATLRLDASLDGVQAAPPRWKKCVAAVKNALPGLTDQLYVEKYFSPEAKQDAEIMMQQLRVAFIQNLDSVEWMDPKTKAAARKKAEAIKFNIGEPKFDAFANNYPVTVESYFNNSMMAYHVRNLEMYSKLDEAVDRKAWSMRASEVNAYYDNGKTALYVPAAILQPPFFSAKYSHMRNFGGIGCIMGHEFSHGFDDTGRKFDAASRLQNWWDRPAVRRFKRRSRCISSLYDTFTIAHVSVDGNGTLGENIADMGGLKIALLAYTNLYAEQEGKAPTEQHVRDFFVAFAQNWCDKTRRKALKASVDTDEHSPNVFRVNGPVSQNANFAHAFGCPAGSPMNPVDKCVLWQDVKPSEELASFRARSRPRGMRGVPGER